MLSFLTLAVLTLTSQNVFFPHAIVGADPSKIEITVRQAPTHVGSLGSLVIYTLDRVTLQTAAITEMRTQPGLDPRDPTLTWTGTEYLLSFFYLNYTSRLNQQVLRRAPTLFELSTAQDILLTPTLAKSASAAPGVLDPTSQRWIWPLYVIPNALSTGSDLATAEFDPRLGVPSVSTPPSFIARGAPLGVYLLEPAIVFFQNLWITFARTARIEDTPGGLAPMRVWTSGDGRATWSERALGTPVTAHHPRTFVRAGGTELWVGYRDLTTYAAPQYQARVRLSQYDPSSGHFVRHLDLYQSTTPHPQNWDCGYVSIVEAGAGAPARAFYYVHEQGIGRVVGQTLQ